MKLLEDLYLRCLNAPYIHTENDGDYFYEIKNNILYLYFQCTNGGDDWKNNFDFPAKPYSDMGIKWRCHRGFLRVWKSIKPFLKDVIMDENIEGVYIVGYSHGAAIATLAHEYVWFNRPDLRNNMKGFGFGCPRCYWGFRVKKFLKERWENFYPIRNINDLVTHVPPVLFGFRHVHKVVELENSDLKNVHRNHPAVDAHYPDNYIYSIQKESEHPEFYVKKE